jgi:hypothetical protein
MQEKLKRKKEYNGRAANEFSSMGLWTKAAIRPGLWNLDTLAKNTKCGGIMIWSLMDIFDSKHNGPFFNYVYRIITNNRNLFRSYIGENLHISTNTFTDRNNFEDSY